MGSLEAPRMLEDTIIAISTPPGIGGVGIVRLSGPKAEAVARKIFKPVKGVSGGYPVRCPILGKLFDPAEKRAVDEAFLTYFKAPHSYTREDIVELSCHGSPVVLEEAVRLGVRAGARPARPGEFTLRAYVNGRLDMLQAEAVNDLIRSSSPAQARISLRQLSGGLSKKIRRFKSGLIRLAAQVEAQIEFPDEALRTASGGQAGKLAAVTADLDRLVASYQAGRALSEGLLLAITGRTNVGKSTLFNALLEEERAIVTPYPGTTRDYLREKIVIEDFVFHLVDMAGLGKPAHPVEKEGMLKGKKIAREADGLLIVLDGSRPAGAEDERLITGFRGKKTVVVINKGDLRSRIDENRVRALSAGSPLVRVSALKGKNMDELRAEIRRTFVPAADFGEDIILHAGQKDMLLEIREALAEGGRLLRAGRGEELYAEELRKALSLLGRLTGEIKADEIMADVFGRFCVGK